MPGGEDPLTDTITEQDLATRLDARGTVDAALRG